MALSTVSFVTSTPVLLLIDSAIAGEWETWVGAVRQLILPATTLALFTLAPIARMTRAAMLSALGADYIRTARAAGLSGGKILYGYAFRNAMLPVITVIHNNAAWGVIRMGQRAGLDFEALQLRFVLVDHRDLRSAESEVSRTFPAMEGPRGGVG